MYLAGVLEVRRLRVEDITEALWGTRGTSPNAVSNLNKKIYAKIEEAWRNRRIEGEHPYLYLDGIVMKRTWAGEVRNVSLLAARSIPRDFGRFSGICEGAKEDKSGLVGVSTAPGRSWRLKGVQLIILRRLPRS